MCLHIFMRSAKTHITAIVENYIRLYPEEYEEFKRGMIAVRAMPRDDFATLDGSKYTRALYEMPETLQTMLIMGLEEEEITWLKAGVSTNRNQGGHWFARTFPVFCIPKKV